MEYGARVARSSRIFIRAPCNRRAVIARPITHVQNNVYVSMDPYDERRCHEKREICISPRLFFVPAELLPAFKDV